jgi:hypothetical protein
MNGVPSFFPEEDTMFSRNSILAGCLIGTAAFAVGFATASTGEEGPAIKSVHHLNLPSDVSEADVAEALGKLNVAVAEAGYPEAGYSSLEGHE